MIEYLERNDLKLKDTNSDGKEGFWAMCTRQDKAYWLDLG